MKILTGSISEHMIFRMPDKGDSPSIQVAIPAKDDATKSGALAPSAITTKRTVIADGKEVEIDPLLPGEREPDFSSLGDGDDDAPAPEKKAADAPPDAKATPPEKKVEPPKKEEKVEPKKDAPLGDVKTGAEDEAAKAAAEQKKAEAAAAKKEEKVEPAQIPENDDDLDAMQPKPGTPPKLVSDIAKVKEQAKIARAEARRLATEKATIEQARVAAEEKLKTVKPMDEETSKEMERLRTFETHTLLENDPKITKEFTEKMEAADARLLQLLQDNGMPEADVKGMKEKGLDNYGGTWWKKAVLDKVAADPLLHQQILDAILARGRVREEKKMRVAAITKDAEALSKQKEAEQKAHWDNFGKKVQEKGAALSKDDPWAKPIEIKEGMTTADKAKAEAHNKQVDARTKTFADNIQKAINHDPEVITELSYKAIHRDILLEESKTHAEEVKKLSDRVAELEADIAATQRTGRIGGPSSAPPKPEGKKATPTPKLGQSVEDAYEEHGI